MMERQWPAFRAALAAPGQPPPVFVALQAIVGHEVGARLFTLMTFDAPTGLSCRIHSSHPREYPVAGLKPLSVGLWSRTVIEERKDIRRRFDRSHRRGFPRPRAHSLSRLRLGRQPSRRV
jgi:hypothetical protein